MNNKSLKIYYLSSEIAPFSNTYSLSTFSKEFNSLLNESKDIDIRLIQPKYGYISERKYILREVIRLKDLLIEFDGKEHIVNLKSAFIPNTRVQLYFMEHKEYFSGINDLLYKSRNGRLYQNNHEKFSFFSKVVLESLSKLFWYPDLIVCNDWQMSLFPVIFKNLYKGNIEQFDNTKVISMFHSYNDLYKFSNTIFKSMNLDCNNKKKHQNTLELAFEYSDFIYLFDDGELIKEINKNKNVKKFIADQKKCKIIDVKELDFSEKIEMYNSLKEDLYSISKK
tara:strand:+ start:2126 stop:2968 length:843 start_codon:yes stop_codon:yes gene_type:complete